MKLDKRLLTRYSTRNLKVYAIPQTQAIMVVGVCFTGGGHHKVYKEIPDGEIWIAEELMKSIEGKYYIYHELYEHQKMAMGMSYNDAHLLANRVEGKARKCDENMLEELIKREMMKNKDVIHERSHFNSSFSLHKGNEFHHAFHRIRDNNENGRKGLTMVR
jgi:hypothetical protein